MKKTDFFFLRVFFSISLACTPSFAQTLTGPDITEHASKAPEIVKTAIPMKAGTPQSALPLEITADKSLTWERNKKIFTARGNAIARQGDTSIAAATLTASYEEKKGGGMKISAVHADGNVTIDSRDSQAYGDHADYDLDKGYAVMTGDKLCLVSPDQTITAKDKFEYNVNAGKLTARGNARALRGADTLEADTLSATMKNSAKGQRKLETLEADGNVIITTPTETVTGKYGIYHAATDKAELTGGVVIHRGPNTLEGDRAEVDLKTNTSQIFGGSHVTGGRVKAVFYPGSERKQP